MLLAGGGGVAPSAPVATAATAITFQSFSANWNASAGATSYRLDVSTDPAFGSFVVNNLNVGNVTTFSVTGLVSLTVYYYRVRAVNGFGTSGNSNVINLTTSLEPVVASWQTRATNNGGSPSPNTISALNTFWYTIRSNGLDTGIFLCNAIAPDDFPCALTPLIVGGGHDPWVDVDMGNGGIVANTNGLLSVYGLVGDYFDHVDTGYIPSGHGPTNTSAGMTIYLSYGGNNDPNPAGNTYCGSFDGTNNFKITDAFTFLAFLYPSCQVSGGFGDNTNGCFGGTVTKPGANWSLGLYGLNSNNAFTSFAPLSVNPVGNPTSTAAWIFDGNQLGGLDNPTGAGISFYAIHAGFSSAQMQIFFTAIQNLRQNGFACGFV